MRIDYIETRGRIYVISVLERALILLRKSRSKQWRVNPGGKTLWENSNDLAHLSLQSWWMTIDGLALLKVEYTEIERRKQVTILFYYNLTSYRRTHTHIYISLSLLVLFLRKSLIFLTRLRWALSCQICQKCNCLTLKRTFLGRMYHAIFWH